MRDTFWMAIGQEPSIGFDDRLARRTEQYVDASIGLHQRDGLDDPRADLAESHLADL
jgi:hypothetical protein